MSIGKYSFFMATAVAATLTAMPAGAATIVDQPGPIAALAGDPGTVLSWTQTDTWTNIAISLELNNSDNSGTQETAELYLTDSTGPGTTQATNGLGYTTFSTNMSGNQSWNAFSGLTLGPGTYYLTYDRTSGSSVDGLDWGIKFDDSTLTLGPGISESEGALTGTLAAYAPASSGFVSDPDSLVVSITGDEVTSAPEPSAMILSGAGLLAVLRLRSRRKA